ncbi:hypothetical protein ACN38_g1600 [Penicillium nordicum]|uniref:Cupin 2 conserved barrel domain-containing protein n=1 Tax=Penicillium nordicum TaxID=229535 RepID=A0A0M8P8I5_9EURO|nr:hypothetical protein ACN38_g1600 [Penicillium nordicum]
MTEKYPTGTRAESERLVREWGFRHIFTWTDGSNAYYSPHSHSGLTTHLIRRGSLTITYPDDNVKLYNGEVKKETFRVGERVDVPAGKVHEEVLNNLSCMHACLLQTEPFAYYLLFVSFFATIEQCLDGFSGV